MLRGVAQAEGREVRTAWTVATQTNLNKAGGAGKKLFILIDSAGTSYTGQIKSLGPNYIELINGSNELTIWYNSRPFRFTTMDLPEGIAFKLGHKELPL